MKLEVGMYVRTNKGIFQIRNKDVFIEDKKQYIGVNGRYTCIDIETITKASHNIIHLIELGDYVNSYPIYEIIEYADNTRAIVIGDDNKSIIWEESSQYIKSIVTKEQFESMAYKVV